MTATYRTPKAVTRQGAMFSDMVEKITGDNRDKIWYLFQQTPEIANDDGLLQLCYWEEFDRLREVLGDKFDDFVKWYLHEATNAESLRRSRQSMTEHGQLPERVKVKARREWLSQVWRKYWGRYR